MLQKSTHQADEGGRVVRVEGRARELSARLAGQGGMGVDSKAIGARPEKEAGVGLGGSAAWTSPQCAVKRLACVLKGHSRCCMEDSLGGSDKKPGDQEGADVTSRRGRAKAGRGSGQGTSG